MTKHVTEPHKLNEILKRHGGPAPRYVAYPSPNVWKDSPPPGERVRRLRTVLEKARPVALYVHVPLCPRLCHYCGCNTEIRPQQPEHGDNYLTGLVAELETIRACTGTRPRISSMHWGGGTPTFLSERQLTELMAIVRDNVEFVPGGELSLESNPETVTTAQLKRLWELGFSRISLGIQDFNRDTQWAINRYHPYERVKSVVENCRNVGLDSINFDLVYGLPNQTVSRFSQTVEKVIDLEPDRVALYHFAYLPASKPHQRALDTSSLPGPGEKFRIFQTASGIFSTSGYLPIGMDHFAKPEDDLTRAFEGGRLKRSFMGYEANPAPDILGVGPSAISYLDGAYLRNVPSLFAWNHAIEHGGQGQDLWRDLTAEDRSRHTLINDLLCNLEIRDDAFAQTLGSLATGTLPALDEFVEDGILARERNCWKVTSFGRPFVRTVAQIFDQYQNLGAETRPASKVA